MLPRGFVCRLGREFLWLFGLADRFDIFGLVDLLDLLDRAGARAPRVGDTLAEAFERRRERGWSDIVGWRDLGRLLPSLEHPPQCLDSRRNSILQSLVKKCDDDVHAIEKDQNQRLIPSDLLVRKEYDHNADNDAIEDRVAHERPCCEDKAGGDKAAETGHHVNARCTPNCSADANVGLGDKYTDQRSGKLWRGATESHESRTSYVFLQLVVLADHR
mmetsp:Transcript_37343/g.92921  ORF Transcript_37343/g.92921 Transcript_37343/m.92921 type:complete len:217 (+) Transcript_37343:898-1548(+)